MTEPSRNWNSQLRKGTAELCVLATLEKGEVYGYQILQTLAQFPEISVKESTIYPILSKAARTGLVSTETRPSDSGPPRRYYRLTKLGRATLKDMKNQWSNLTRSVNELCNIPNPSRHDQTTHD